MRIFTLGLLAFCAFANANQGDRYNSEVQNAKNAVSQSLNQPAFKSFDVNSYCKDAACQQQIQNPDQSKYFGNDAGMIDDGNIALANDPNAKNIVDAQKKRPKYDIDPNDPALKRAKGYMDDSYNISHGISSKYHDCEGGLVCDINPSTQICSTPTNAPVACYNEPFATLIVGTTHKTCPPGWSLNGMTCSATVKQFRYDGRNYVSWWQDKDNGMTVTRYRWNNNTVKPPTYTRGKQVGGGTYSKRYQICGPVSQSQPVKLSCDSGFTLSGGQCVRNEFEWKSNCDVLGNCDQQGAQVCVEGAGTRTINGVPTYLDCWKYRLDYQCDSSDGCDQFIGSSTKSEPTYFDLAPTYSDCKEEKRVCTESILGVCIKEEVTLNCQERTCEDRNLICGEASFCLDGDCYAGEGQKNDNFAESAAGLAALGAAAEDFSEDTVNIFTGNPAFCDKKPIGLSDCCSDDGWGNDIGLTECSAEEKGLGEAKKKKLTIKLGEYCAEEVLSVCIRKKQSYCQFDSKMARIIQEQGKVQLGISFGDKKNPNCIGITPEQMQQLDFSKIDFSDFYEDMEEGMELPDMEHLQNTIKDKFTDVE